MGIAQRVRYRAVFTASFELTALIIDAINCIWRIYIVTRSRKRGEGRLLRWGRWVRGGTRPDPAAPRTAARRWGSRAGMLRSERIYKPAPFGVIYGNAKRSH